MQNQIQSSVDEQKFMDLMRSLFSEELRAIIKGSTHFKELKEWSSLQTMIVVNEIDQKYHVILGIDDFMKTNTFEELFKVVQSKSK